MKLNFTGVYFKNEASREFQITYLADICSSFIFLPESDSPEEWFSFFCVQYITS